MSQWQLLLLRYVAYTIIYRGTLNAHVAQSGTEGDIHRGWTMRSLTAAPFLQKPHDSEKELQRITYIHIENQNIWRKVILFPSFQFLHMTQTVDVDILKRLIQVAAQTLN